MPGAAVGVSLNDHGFAAGIQQLIRLGHDRAPLLRAIGVGLVETTRERFETATDPQGQPWKPWSRGYAAITSSNSILRGRGMSGGLMGSITFETERDGVRIGSNKIYAGVHQGGATIVPKSAKALFLPMMGASGHVFGVRARKVTIPARPYLGLGAADRLVIAEAFELEIAHALASPK